MSSSIFNDVIGPVMRGPSSSHVAGAARIGDLVRQFFAAPLKKVVCDFDPTGSLAESYTGHGTVIGFPAGLMGIPLTDSRVDKYEDLLHASGLEIEYRILEYGAQHPGNYRMNAEAADGTIHNFEAIALGGGMVELQKVDSYQVAIGGDYDELLIEFQPKEHASNPHISDESEINSGSLAEMLEQGAAVIGSLEDNFCEKAEMLEQGAAAIGSLEDNICEKAEILEQGATAAGLSECNPIGKAEMRSLVESAFGGKGIESVGFVDVAETIAEIVGGFEAVDADVRGGSALLDFKLAEFPSDNLVGRIAALPEVLNVYRLHAILPTHSYANTCVPYESCEELMAFAEGKEWPAWRYAAYYESIRGGRSEEEVVAAMKDILGVMKGAVATGLAGTSYDNRVLGPQAYKMVEAQKDSGAASTMPRKSVLPTEPLNTMIRNITAVMETKSSMGLIVAAPTVGSSGCLPGTMTALAEVYGFTDEEIAEALLVAGLVGVFFANEATFSAEVGGCQVECGAASGMAAAGIVSLMGGTIRECMDAASVALQNITGLACDPVANRVEVPCLGKNVMAGTNALSAANMILAGFDAVIPLDQTIKAIYDIGLSLPLELRCTYGGLGKTDASNAIRKRLDG